MYLVSFKRWPALCRDHIENCVIATYWFLLCQAVCHDRWRDFSAATFVTSLSWTVNYPVNVSEDIILTDCQYEYRCTTGRSLSSLPVVCPRASLGMLGLACVKRKFICPVGPVDGNGFVLCVNSCSCLANKSMGIVFDECEIVRWARYA